jgi:hypothetical protein
MLESQFWLSIYFKLTCGQYYKTFYGCKLRIFLISWSVTAGNPSQDGIVFVSKAGAYPCKHLSGAPLKGRLLALPTNN